MIQLWKDFLFGDEGQTATEYMLVISGVVVATIAAAFAFVPVFHDGVADLARDVREILSDGDINGSGSATMRRGGTP